MKPEQDDEEYFRTYDYSQFDKMLPQERWEILAQIISSAIKRTINKGEKYDERIDKK